MPHEGPLPPRPRRGSLVRRGELATSPGTLVAPDSAPADAVLRVVRFTPEDIKEETIERPSAEDVPGPGPEVEWVDVRGLHDLELLRSLGARFGLHRLTLEDILGGAGLASTDFYESYLYVVVPRPAREDNRITTNLVSVVLTKESVLTLHDVRGDIFTRVRDRMRNPTGHIRNSGPDYLAYVLIDALIDEYYPYLAEIDDRLDELEGIVVGDPVPIHLLEIRHLKDDLQILRRAIWSLREVVSQLVADDTGAFTDATRVYLRNVYSHAVELLEVVEIHRETVFGLTDLYLASISNRMNEVMKVLTLIATIFIPLTFVVGVYGMNFDYMPELREKWGYPLVMTIMATISVAMLLYFKKKKWL